jgi:malonyl-CoA O-methyltransferase
LILLKRDFSRAAASYDAAAALANETGRRLGERLSYTKIAPRRIADIGCATGAGAHELRTRFPEAQTLAIDWAKPMLRAVQARSSWWQRLRHHAPMPLQADVRALPLADASLDLVWSNLMLHWLDEPLPAFQELARVTATGGLITFAMLGPDSFREWGEALDSAGLRDVGTRRFADMHDIGDMLVKAGFGDPVMDREDIVLTYPSVRALVAEQRHLGVRNGVFGALDWRRARRALAQWPEIDGRKPLTYEIVYGQAWRMPPRAKSSSEAQSSVIRFYPSMPT